MAMKMKDKTALIVGATSGIGAAAATEFAKQGANVVIAGRNAERGEAVVESVKSNGVNSLFIEVDVTSMASVDELVTQAVSHFSTIDYAFNNAGWESVPANIHEIEEADWDKMHDIKLKGVWRSMKAELRQMLEQGSGAIVNMAGNWGVVGFPQYGAYCAAAHGIMGLTKAAAMEYASKGIRINAVCPGAVDTPLLDRMVGGNEDIKNSFGVTLPMGRIAKPEEVAKAVVWLCSDEASYVTGDGLLLNGGA